MSRWIVFASLFVAGVTGAYLLGRGSTQAPTLEDSSVAAPEPPSETAALEAEIERLRSRLAAERSATESPRPDAAGEGGAADPTTSAPEGTSPASGAAGAALDLGELTTASEVSDRLMAFADAQLDRGPDGYLAILRSMEQLARNPDLQKLFYDESVALRELYPWIRFLVESEDRVVDMSEWVFRSMAEDPQAFHGMEDDMFEIFTEGVGALLPGAVPEDRLVAFREYAAKIIEAPEESQSDVIRKSRSDIERLLSRYWAEPIDPAKAFELLKSGSLDFASPQASAVLRTLTPEQIAQLDVARILTPLVERSDYQAIQLLERLPDGAVNTGSLDAVVLRRMDEGGTNAGWLRGYLHATGRLGWAGARDFVERGLAGAEQARIQAVQILAWLPAEDRPDKAYVADLLRRYEFPENYARWLKSQYGIED